MKPQKGLQILKIGRNVNKNIKGQGKLITDHPWLEKLVNYLKKGINLEYHSKELKKRLGNQE